MNCWLLSIVISACTATEVFYVLPNNVSDVNCQFRPCATLGHYFLDNGSLPVLSNVEYHFLPGEHYIIDIMQIRLASNLSLIGVGLSSIKLVCRPQVYVAVSYSYNVTIGNLVFSQCNGIYEFGKNISVSLILQYCYFCRIEDVVIWDHGFVGHNLLNKSFLNNITINMNISTPTLDVCGHKFLLVFADEENYFVHDSILINQLSISGHTKMCCEFAAMQLQLYQSNYSVSVELHNSWFHNMDQSVLFIHAMYYNNSLSIKNCTFEYCDYTLGYLNPVIYGKVPSNDMIISFEGCIFIIMLLMF